MFILIGGGLLLIWRQHPSQTFARDLGYSTLFGSLVAVAYYFRNNAPAPFDSLAMPILILGAIPNLYFLCSGVLRLAERRLPLWAVAVFGLLLAALVMLAPQSQRVLYWGLLNMPLLLGLGAAATYWLRHTGTLERLIGPLLILLGLNQLALVALGEDGVAANLFGATVLRVAIGGVFLFASLERAKAEVAKLGARFQLMTEHSVQGVVVTDGKRILYANPAARQIYGVPLGLGNYVLFANMPYGTFSDDHLQRNHAQIQSRKAAIVKWEGRREVAGGRELELRYEAWLTDWDGVSATQILITDDTERNASARALLHQATHDKLTGLPNRTVLMQRLKEYCYLADGSLQCTLVVLNIDRFKLFNESQGQVVGDHVLRAFSAKLKDALGARAELMRLGGDEFAIVDPEASSAHDIAQRLQNACAQALVVAGGEYFIDASMGMAVFPDNAGNADALLRAANGAMYKAKRMPGTSLAMAEGGSEQKTSNALEQEQALRKGIKNQEIYLNYQPKIDAHSGKLLGFEALARWQRPGVGPVSPIEFIGIAERTGLIQELGAMLLNQACGQIAQWLREVGDCVPVAVNVSPIQLLNRGFLQIVENTIKEHAVPVRYLTLEITESAAIDNLEDTQIQLRHLRNLGIHVAMDDFGTGFSSLSMLRELPLSTLKIDRGLIDPLPAPDAVAVVTAICRLAEALDMQVVAEGIETLEHSDSARDAGCHELQGYYYARPLSVLDAGGWLNNMFAADQAAPQLTAQLAAQDDGLTAA